MTKIILTYNTNLPPARTTWMDYLSFSELIIFTLFIAVCSIVTARMAQARRLDILIKHPIGLQLMYLGSLLHVISIFIIDQQVDWFDPILLSDAGCMIWSFWIMIPGVLLWYSFFLYSLLSYMLYCMKAIEEKYIEKANHPEKNTVYSESPTEEPAEGNEKYVTEQKKRSPILSIQTVVMTFAHLGWQAPKRHKLFLTRVIGIAFILFSGLLLCILAQAYGATTYTSKHNTCSTEWEFKLSLALMFNLYLAFLWVVFIILKKKGNLPALYADDYGKVLIATTLVAEIMIGLNTIGFTNYSFGRTIYLNILIAMYVACIWYMSGKSMLDYMRGRKDMVESVRKAMNTNTCPKIFTQVHLKSVDDPHMLSLEKTFISWLKKDCSTILWLKVNNNDYEKFILSTDSERGVDDMGGNFDLDDKKGKKESKNEKKTRTHIMFDQVFSFRDYEIYEMRLPHESAEQLQITIMKREFEEKFAEGYFPILPWKLGHLYENIIKRRNLILRYSKELIEMKQKPNDFHVPQMTWLNTDRKIINYHFSGYGYPNDRTRKAFISWFSRDNVTGNLIYTKDECDHNGSMRTLDREDFSSHTLAYEDSFFQGTDTLPTTLNWVMKLKDRLHGTDMNYSISDQCPYIGVANFIEMIFDGFYWPEFVEKSPEMQTMKVSAVLNDLLMKEMQEEYTGGNSVYQGPGSLDFRYNNQIAASYSWVLMIKRYLLCCCYRSDGVFHHGKLYDFIRCKCFKRRPRILPKKYDLMASSGDLDDYGMEEEDGIEMGEMEPGFVSVNIDHSSGSRSVPELEDEVN